MYYLRMLSREMGCEMANRCITSGCSLVSDSCFSGTGNTGRQNVTARVLSSISVFAHHCHSINTSCSRSTLYLLRSLSLSLYIYIYTYIYICVCVCNREHR
jgi:hypothetical protein